jgi:hypothetical protein
MVLSEQPPDDASNALVLYSLDMELARLVLSPNPETGGHALPLPVFSRCWDVPLARGLAAVGHVGLRPLVGLAWLGDVADREAALRQWSAAGEALRGERAGALRASLRELRGCPSKWQAFWIRSAGYVAGEVLKEDFRRALGESPHVRTVTRGLYDGAGFALTWLHERTAPGAQDAEVSDEPTASEGGEEGPSTTAPRSRRTRPASADLPHFASLDDEASELQAWRNFLRRELHGAPKTEGADARWERIKASLCRGNRMRTLCSMIASGSTIFTAPLICSFPEVLREPDAAAVFQRRFAELSGAFAAEGSRRRIANNVKALRPTAAGRAARPPHPLPGELRREIVRDGALVPDWCVHAYAKLLGQQGSGARRRERMLEQRLLRDMLLLVPEVLDLMQEVLRLRGIEIYPAGAHDDVVFQAMADFRQRSWTPPRASRQLQSAKLPDETMFLREFVLRMFVTAGLVRPSRHMLWRRRMTCHEQVPLWGAVRARQVSLDAPCIHLLESKGLRVGSDPCAAGGESLVRFCYDVDAEATPQGEEPLVVERLDRARNRENAWCEAMSAAVQEFCPYLAGDGCAARRLAAAAWDHCNRYNLSCSAMSNLRGLPLLLLEEQLMRRRPGGQELGLFRETHKHRLHDAEDWRASAKSRRVQLVFVTMNEYVRSGGGVCQRRDRSDLLHCIAQAGPGRVVCFESTGRLVNPFDAMFLRLAYPCAVVAVCTYSMEGSQLCSVQSRQQTRLAAEYTSALFGERFVFVPSTHLFADPRACRDVLDADARKARLAELQTEAVRKLCGALKSQGYEELSGCLAGFVQDGSLRQQLRKQPASREAAVQVFLPRSCPAKQLESDLCERLRKRVAVAVLDEQALRRRAAAIQLRSYFVGYNNRFVAQLPVEQRSRCISLFREPAHGDDADLLDIWRVVGGVLRRFAEEHLGAAPARVDRLVVLAPNVGAEEAEEAASSGSAERTEVVDLRATGTTELEACVPLRASLVGAARVVFVGYSANAWACSLFDDGVQLMAPSASAPFASSSAALPPPPPASEVNCRLDESTQQFLDLFYKENNVPQPPGLREALEGLQQAMEELALGPQRPVFRGVRWQSFSQSRQKPTAGSNVTGLHLAFLLARDADDTVQALKDCRTHLLELKQKEASLAEAPAAASERSKRRRRR